MHAHLTLNRSVPAPWDVKAGVLRHRRPRVPCLSAEDRSRLESTRATEGPFPQILTWTLVLFLKF